MDARNLIKALAGRSGLPHEQRGGFLCISYNGLTGNAGIFGAFEPSDSWRDAMFAAEKFGLFDGRILRHVKEWEVTRHEDGWWVESVLATTGPLAVSRAIALLALEGK